MPSLLKITLIVSNVFKVSFTVPRFNLVWSNDLRSALDHPSEFLNMVIRRDRHSIPLLKHAFAHIYSTAVLNVILKLFYKNYYD